MRHLVMFASSLLLTLSSLAGEVKDLINENYHQSGDYIFIMRKEDLPTCTAKTKSKTYYGGKGAEHFFICQESGQWLALLPSELPTMSARKVCNGRFTSATGKVYQVDMQLAVFENGKIYARCHYGSLTGNNAYAFFGEPGQLKSPLDRLTCNFDHIVFSFQKELTPAQLKLTEGKTRLLLPDEICQEEPSPFPAL